MPAGASTPSTGNASIIVTPTATGSTVYTVTLTNNLNCTSSKNITVPVNLVPVVSITADYCAVPGKVKLTANATPGSAFLWSTGETTQSVNVDIAATYQVTATLGNGCPATASISVAQELVVNGHFDAGNTAFTVRRLVQTSINTGWMLQVIMNWSPKDYTVLDPTRILIILTSGAMIIQQVPVTI